MTGLRIHLIRHGTHDVVAERLCGRQGVSLNDAGRRQAGAVARRLSTAPIGAIYSSPVVRTRETADVIAQTCGLVATPDPGLEEMDFGDWTGLAFADLDAQPAWRRWNDDRDRSRAPNGESMADAQARMAAWFDRVGAHHAEGAIAAVSHADVIKSAVAYALGLSLHFHDRFEISPGSLTTLVVSETGLKVIAVNEVPDGRTQSG